MGLLDMNDPEAMSQLALSMGLLTAKQGQPWPALIAQYAQSVQQRREQALRDQLLQQQLQGGGLALKTQQQQFDDNQKAREVLRSNMGPEPQAPVRAPGGGLMTAPQAPGAAVSGVVPGKNQTFTFYKAIGDKMAAQGLPEQAQKYYDLAEKYRPKLKDTKTLTDPNTQQRVTVNFYEDGTHEVVPLAPDQEKAHFTDEGGQVTARDPFTGAPRGGPIAKTMTPDAIASNRVALGNLDLSRQRFGFEQSQANKPQVVTSPNGDVYTVDARAGTGQTVSGPDGKPLTVGSKLTEAQAKASVYYGQMRGASETANKIVVEGFNPSGKDQGSYAQARAASSLSDNHPVLAAALNVMTPAKAQKYQQSAEQWAEAYLRFNTGAATNHSEIVRYARIFFPMPGDTPDVVAQKNQSRVQAEQMMRIAANNGAPQVEGAIGGGAPVADDPLGIRKK